MISPEHFFSFNPARRIIGTAVHRIAGNRPWIKSEYFYFRTTCAYS